MPCKGDVPLLPPLFGREQAIKVWRGRVTHGARWSDTLLLPELHLGRIYPLHVLQPIRASLTEALVLPFPYYLAAKRLRGPGKWGNSEEKGKIFNLRWKVSEFAIARKSEIWEKRGAKRKFDLPTRKTDAHFSSYGIASPDPVSICLERGTDSLLISP